MGLRFNPFTGTLDWISVEDLSGYVPYAGATGAVDLGANNLTVDTNVLFVGATNDRVGIGTTAPAYKLDVLGDINSSSDINLKENVKTIGNSLETINSLRGVSFDWKKDGRSSYGIIAQELEEVLPELVKNGEVKSVNYNGLIGVLIEAIKELKAEVEELKSKS
jgi:hypothetical protein